MSFVELPMLEELEGKIEKKNSQRLIDISDSSSPGIHTHTLKTFLAYIVFHVTVLFQISYY